MKNVNSTDYTVAGNVSNKSIEKELKHSYIDYAMSVIVGRALPLVLDGLKPVHRRILYSMYESNTTHDKPYKKSARTVGDVLGKFHPHGDTAVYDALVRMAQPFSMRYPLIDGQGNFGSVDGDNAAAMRYTEARLTEFAEELLEDIDKGTVGWIDNFDNSLKEPLYLPSKVPNLLLNGSSGIAVGMATQMAPHNIVEVINVILKYLDNENLGIDDILQIMPGPDFPTGGIIYGRAGIISYYRTGKGTLTVRSKIEVTKRKDRTILVIKEIPYSLNKSNLIESIVTAIREDKVLGIQDVRDESDRDGIHIVIELKRSSNPDIVINQLYKHTRIEYSFGVNNVVLVDGKPVMLTILDLVKLYVKHRTDVVVKRSEYTLKKDKERLNILDGLTTAINNIDEVISIIKKSRDTAEARLKLKEKYLMNEEQVKAIMEMRLQRLTALEVESIKKEVSDIKNDIVKLETILGSVGEQHKIIKEELNYLVRKYGDKRRTEIAERGEELLEEDLIPNIKNFVILTENNYIKRIPLSLYKEQNRGGHGSRTMDMKKEDAIHRTINAYSHDNLLLFSSTGKVYNFKCYNIPEGSKQSRGKPIVQLIPSIAENEKIEAVIPVSEMHDDKIALLFSTAKGVVKTTVLNQFKNIRASGIRAIKLDPDDRIISIKSFNTDKEANVFIATRLGLAIRFNVNNLRLMGRATRGVRGIRLNAGDEVVLAEITEDSDYLLAVTTNGYGKRTAVSTYRKVHRGGKGVKTIKLTDKNGKIAGIQIVNDVHDVILSTKNGKSLRSAGKSIRIMSRNTIGVRLMKIDPDDYIVSISIDQPDTENKDDLLNKSS